MANVKDEGKKMDPLFPRLHISDADKGSPRTPPRNKMALSQQFNVPSQRCISGSVSPILPSQSSSYHVSFNFFRSHKYSTIISLIFVGPFV